MDYADWTYSPSHRVDHCAWLSRVITIHAFGCSARPAFRLPNTEYRTVSPFLNVEAWAFQPKIENSGYCSFLPKWAVLLEPNRSDKERMNAGRSRMNAKKELIGVGCQVGWLHADRSRSIEFGAFAIASGAGEWLPLIRITQQTVVSQGCRSASSLLRLDRHRHPLRGGQLQSLFGRNGFVWVAIPHG